MQHHSKIIMNISCYFYSFILCNLQGSHQKLLVINIFLLKNFSGVCFHLSIMNEHKYDQGHNENYNSNRSNGDKNAEV